MLSGGALLLFNMGAPIEPEARSRTPHRPSAQRIRALVDEFLRVLGLASVGLGREEYILLEDGAGLLRKMTIDLMLEKSGVGPADRGGALRLNSYLTPDQRAALEAMPPLSADRDSAIAVHQALARIFLPLAKNLASEIGAEWPSAFEDATRRSLRERLGIEI